MVDDMEALTMVKPCAGMQERFKYDFASQILSSETAKNVSSLLKVQEAFQIHDRYSIIHGGVIV